MNTSETLLKAILATVARRTFPPRDLLNIISPNAAGQKQINAYNLCDGETPQSEVGKRVRLDKGNLSRSISRWVEAGIMVRIGPDKHPMHLYRLPKEYSKSTSKPQRKSNER